MTAEPEAETPTVNDKDAADCAPAESIQAQPPLAQRLYHLLIRSDPQSPRPRPTGIRKRDFGFLPIPKPRRWDPDASTEAQFKFTWRTNLTFALAATISVMNLYYIQPMLVAVARDFNVSNEVVSRVPTLVQGGYGCGILLITPLGDLIRRRPFILLLYVLGATLSIALALARNVQMLAGVSFIVGMVTVTPQIAIPWTADLAPSHIRGRAMSITLSGLLFGLVFGRLLGGIFANFTSWRDSYWLAVALQGTMLLVLYASLPDTPDKGLNISYLEILGSMVQYLYRYPTLVQVVLCQFLVSATFGGFWVTLTFLLSGPPYHYDAFKIGLIGLLGIIGALAAPQWGRLVDNIVPWTGQLIGMLMALIAMVISVSAADINLGGVCVAIILLDCGAQLSQVAGNYRLAGIDPNARARLNSLSILAIFTGTTSGTAISSKIYNSHGWKASAGTGVAFTGAAIIVILLRGPHEHGWIGWHGGTELFRRVKLSDSSPTAVTEVTRWNKAAVQTAHRTGGAASVDLAEMGSASFVPRDPVATVTTK